MASILKRGQKDLPRHITEDGSMDGATARAVLGVSSSASQHEIRQVFRRLARQVHPDVDPMGAAAFRRLTIARDAALAEARARRSARRWQVEPAASRPTFVLQDIGGRTPRPDPVAQGPNGRSFGQCLDEALAVAG